MVRKERFVNNASTTLTSSLTDSQTNIPVVSTAGFPDDGDFRLLIDSEIMLITIISGTTFTAVRGSDNTIAASHADSSTVTAILTQGALSKFSRDSDPWVNLRPPYRIIDSSGATLTASNFTEVNFAQNAASSDDDGNITISKDDHTTTSNSLLVRSSPSTPYTITGAVTWNFNTDNVVGGTLIGLAFRESGTGRIILHAIQPSNTPAHRILYHSSPTTNGIDQASARSRPHTQVIWQRIEDDGTDIKFYFSSDGFNFILRHTELRGANFSTGPNQVGFCINNDDGKDGASVSLVAWDGE